MKNKKSYKIGIAVIVVIVVAVIGFIIYKGVSDVKESHKPTSVTSVVEEESKAALNIDLQTVMITPSDGYFDYEENILSAYDEEGNDVKDKVTWTGEIDLTKIGEYDCIYTLKLDTVTLTKSTHVSVVNPEYVKDGELMSEEEIAEYEAQKQAEASANSSSGAVIEDGDSSNATTEQPYRQYSSLDFPGGSFSGTAEGTEMPDDKTFKVVDYNSDQMQAFNAAKAYADSGAGNYTIYELTDDNLMFYGYRVCFAQKGMYEWMD